MPHISLLTSQALSAFLTLVVAVLAAGAKPSRLKSAAWSLVVAVGLFNALSYATFQGNLIHSNFIHYYIGPKYQPGYIRFYEAMNLALNRPFAPRRDLESPERTINETEGQQRREITALLRREGVAFDRAASVADLEARARAGGVLERESTRRLAEMGLDEDKVRQLRADLDFASRVSVSQGSLALDHGYNGSPFFALLRQVDPTLHRPLSLAAGYVNVTWQILGILFVVALAGRALRWERGDVLLVWSMILVSRDFVVWILPGLVFAGWLLPVALLLWAVSRKRAALAGAALAWAGLLKLFPFALGLPFGVDILRRLLLKMRRDPAAAAGDPFFTLRVLAAAAAAVVVFVAASSFGGLTWKEFLEKIGLQFHVYQYVANAAGVSQLLTAAGIAKTSATLLLKLTVLATFFYLAWRESNEDPGERFPYLLVLLLSMMGFLVETWANYYTPVAFLLLPTVLRRYRFGGVVLIVFFAASYLLPDFGTESYLDAGGRYALKVIPYLALPLTALLMEFQREVESSAAGVNVLTRGQRLARRALALALLPALAWIAVDVRRQNAAYGLFEDGRRHYAAGRVEEARDAYQRLADLSPGDTITLFNLGQTYQDLGQFNEAVACYQRVLAIDPSHASALNNVALLELSRRNTSGGIDLLLRSHARTPWDEIVCYNLALALHSIGKKDEAALYLQQALDINPKFEAGLELEKAWGK